MKKIMLIAAAIVALVSCTKEQFKETSDTFEKGQVVTLKIEAPAQTKATSSADATTGEVSFKWEATDAIKVTVGTSEATFTVSRLINEGASAEFTGTMPAGGETFDVQFPATDPAIATQTYSSTEAIPHNMMKFTATNCSVANPSFTLSAANAVLRLNLWGDKTVGKIVVTNTSSSETPKPSYTLNIQDGKTLGSTSAAATSFFIVVPDGSYKFSAEIFDNSATPASICKFEPTNAQTFTAAKILNMPAKEVKAGSSGPEGALTGVFSVSATKKVHFSKGNLQATCSVASKTNPQYTWAFAENQYDYVGNAAGNITINPNYQQVGEVVDLFGWSTANTNYGISASENDDTYEGEFKDWGTIIDNSGTWFTLSIDEWSFLIGNTSPRSSSLCKHAVTVCGKTNCLVIAPDNFDGTIADSYDASAWATAQAAGLVCLPPAGDRLGCSVTYGNLIIGARGEYWSSTSYSSKSSYYLDFHKNSASTTIYMNKRFGLSVRLVTAVQ